VLKRSWFLSGSTHGSDDKYFRNIRVTVFCETPEEACAQFRAEFPVARLWSITHGGKVIVSDSPAEGDREATAPNLGAESMVATPKKGN
jgi:hypothetical protein